MRLLSAVPVFVDINKQKVTLNSRMNPKMSLFHQKRMKIICNKNMCNIWFTFHIYIIRSGVCQFTFLYHISIVTFLLCVVLYPTKGKNVLHIVTLTREYGITCINLNHSHLSAEFLSLKVRFALFTKGCPVGLLKHHQVRVKKLAKHIKH